MLVPGPVGCHVSQSIRGTIRALEFAALQQVLGALLLLLPCLRSETGASIVLALHCLQIFLGVTLSSASTATRLGSKRLGATNKTFAGWVLLLLLLLRGLSVH